MVLTFWYLEKCHHNIIYEKINILIPVPSSYVHEVWGYGKANVKSVQKVIQTFVWVKAFGNLSVDGLTSKGNTNEHFWKLYFKQNSQM